MISRLLILSLIGVGGFLIVVDESTVASSREFLEEISGIKYTGDPVELSAIQKVFNQCGFLTL